MGPGRARPRSVVIAGGGIAGIGAALRLAEMGVAVTLLETRKKLGGRATSFVDARSGRTLDNCQHVMLGCCTNYADLLERLGASGQIEWHARQHWIEAGGRVSVIGPSAFLPAPGHFGLSMIRAPFLSLRDSTAIGVTSLEVLAADRTRHRGRTFADFLAGTAMKGGGERVVRRFWGPVVVSACNLSVDRVAASAALHVFQEGFLANHRAAAIGIPSVPLVELYDKAESAIAAAGGRVVLGASVTGLDETSVTVGGGGGAAGVVHRADRTICALPFERVLGVVDAAARRDDPRFDAIARFTHSPILGVHMVFDRPVLRTPHAVLVDRPTQWLFRKDAEGRSIHAVISGADGWVDLTEGEITARIIDDLHACLPHSRGAVLLQFRAVKEKRATFAPTPEVELIRPRAVREDGGGVVLAGDYTDTGWPATMEGATRSGYAAAAAVLGRRAEEFLVPPLKVAALSRALAG